MNEPAHLDLFSGIGGFALAAQWAGFRTIGFSEIDPYACAVLRKHWPDVPNLGDIRKFGDWPDLGDVSILTGGFPCQPFSVAGQRKGSRDDRHLWPAMRDVIGRCRPAWVLGENVPGLIGVELDNVLSDLESLGYRVQPIVVPACAVDAPHRRDRVWIVAHATGDRCGETGQGQSYEPGEALADTASVGRQGQGQCGKRSRPATNREGKASDVEPVSQQCEWLPEPELGRVAHGIPRRVDRLKALGNSIVPQVAYEILRHIRKLIP